MTWLAPTVRLVRWWSLVVPGATAMMLGSLVRLDGEPLPALMALFLAAAFAAAAPASLDDPAHELLGAVPTTARRRVGHRLVVIVPAGMVSWALMAAIFGSQRNLAVLGALVALGVAVACVVTRFRPDAAAAAGVATPLAAVTVHWLQPDSGPLGSLSRVWLDHPGPTIVVAAAAAIVATTDPARPRHRRSCS